MNTVLKGLFQNELREAETSERLRYFESRTLLLDWISDMVRDTRSDISGSQVADMIDAAFDRPAKKGKSR